MKKIEIVLPVAIAILVSLGSVFLFSLKLDARASALDESAKVANVVDGMTAPAIGIIGAVLVYLSFKAQVKANKLQFEALNEQRDLQLIYSFYQELKEDLLRMQSEYGAIYEQKAILDSFMKSIFEDDNVERYPEFRLYLDFIFNQFKFVSNRIKRKNSLNLSEQVYIIQKVKYQFDLYFRGYHKDLTQQLFSSDYSKDLKNKLEDVHLMLERLEKIREDNKKILIHRVK